MYIHVFAGYVSRASHTRDASPRCANAITALERERAHVNSVLLIFHAYGMNPRSKAE